MMILLGGGSINIFALRFLETMKNFEANWDNVIFFEEVYEKL